MGEQVFEGQNLGALLCLTERSNKCSGSTTTPWDGVHQGLRPEGRMERMVQVQISGGRKIAPLRFLPFRSQRQEFQFGVGAGFIPARCPSSPNFFLKEKSPVGRHGAISDLGVGQPFLPFDIRIIAHRQVFCNHEKYGIFARKLRKKRRTGE